MELNQLDPIRNHNLILYVDKLISTSFASTEQVSNLFKKHKLYDISTWALIRNSHTNQAKLKYCVSCIEFLFIHGFCVWTPLIIIYTKTYIIFMYYANSNLLNIIQKQLFWALMNRFYVEDSNQFTCEYSIQKSIKISHIMLLNVDIIIT